MPVAVVAVFGVLGLAKDVGWLAFVASRKEPITIGGQSIRLPSLRDALVQIAFGLVQISLMTTILYLFMPPELNMTWPAFVAIYCLAFVAGQLSNVPAGLGVLEAALFLMLPQIPPGKLVGAVLAYRAVYEVIPLGVRAAVAVDLRDHESGGHHQKEAQNLRLVSVAHCLPLPASAIGMQAWKPPGTATYCSTCVAPTCDVKNPSSVSSFIIRTNGRLRSRGRDIFVRLLFLRSGCGIVHLLQERHALRRLQLQERLAVRALRLGIEILQAADEARLVLRRIHVLEDHVDERRHTDFARARRVGARQDRARRLSSTIAPSSLLRNSGCQPALGFGEQPLSTPSTAGAEIAPPINSATRCRTSRRFMQAVVAHTFIRFSSPTAWSTARTVNAM